LTLSYGALLSAILIGFSGTVYMRMRHHLLDLTDTALREELVELEAEITRAKELSSSSDELNIQFSGAPGFVFKVATLSGNVVYQSTSLGSEALPALEGEVLGSSRPLYRSVALRAVGPARLASRVIPHRCGPLRIQVAASLAPNAHALKDLVVIALAISPLALVCAVGGGYWLAHQALALVDRMAAGAAEITSTQLDRRLDEPATEDELSGLARTFNAMIARRQRSFEQVRRFTADAAHELRTPLATMRTEAEVALRSPRSPEGDACVLENLPDEIERLSRLVSHLLFLSREDAGIRMGDFQPVHLDDLARKVGEHMQVAAREKGVKLVVDLPESCRVSGDAQRLRQLFFNLLDNAVKYTPANGDVSVLGQSSGSEARVTIADTGVGIPADHLPHVFDRFYRVDPSRRPEMDGTGLGLAVCRSIAEAHGGHINIQSISSSGTQVSLSLPVLKELVSTQTRLPAAEPQVVGN
jgi:heavy metal sensor kinase